MTKCTSYFFTAPYSYRAWDDVNNRNSRNWTQDFDFGATYNGARMTQSIETFSNPPYRTTDFSYDADGRQTVSYVWEAIATGSTDNRYDAAGYSVRTTDVSYTGLEITTQRNRNFDGDGQMVKEEITDTCPTCTQQPPVIYYYIRSSLLIGGLIATTDGQGNKTIGYVYAGGRLIASRGDSNGQSIITWRHDAPTGSSKWWTWADFSTNGNVTREEFDPVGANMGTDNPYAGCGCVNNNENSGDLWSRYGDATDFSNCNVDGVQTPCSLVMKLWNADIVEQCPDNECGPRVATSNGESALTQPFISRVDGVSGFYLGDDSFGVMLQGDTDLDAVDESSDPMDYASFFIDPPQEKKKKRKSKSNRAKIRVKPAHPPLGTAHVGVATPQPVRRKQPNDCLNFARLVDNIAKRIFDNVEPGEDPIQLFMDALARNFTKFRSAYSTEVAQKMLSPEHDNRYRDRGFKRVYWDHEGENASPNQVRHAVGGLIAGYLWGVNKGGPFMNSREDRNTPSGRADIALNNVTIPMGEKIGERSWGGSTVGARLAAANLGNWIRENLCGE